VDAERFNVFTALVTLLLASACAPGPYDVEVRYPGAFDAKAVKAAQERIYDLPWGAGANVRVIEKVSDQDPLPEGLALEDGKLRIDAVERYEMLGEVTVHRSASPSELRILTAWLHAPMHVSAGEGRRIYCGAQTSLRLLTLGIWTIFVPLNYPCLVTYPESTGAAMAIHVGEIRRAAVVLGGNLALVLDVYRGAVDTPSVFGPFQTPLAKTYVLVNRTEMHNATMVHALILRDRGR
jgi:hypothetical protein